MWELVAGNRTTVAEKVDQPKKPISVSVDLCKTTMKANNYNTLEHQPTVWPVLKACTQPYHLRVDYIGLLVLLLPDGYTMLMRPNKVEVALHGCHCSGDMGVRMCKVLARPWVGVRVCHLLILLFYKFLLPTLLNKINKIF